MDKKHFKLNKYGLILNVKNPYFDCGGTCCVETKYCAKDIRVEEMANIKSFI